MYQQRFLGNFATFKIIRFFEMNNFKSCKVKKPPKKKIQSAHQHHINKVTLAVEVYVYILQFTFSNLYVNAVNAGNP